MPVRWLIKASFVALLSTVLMPAGSAQQGSPSSYPAPGKSYGSATAIGLAAGGAAVIAMGIYVLHHRHASRSQEATLAGCTQMSNGALMLLDEDTKTTYWLSSRGKDIRVGDRLIVSGKKSRGDSGINVFRVQKLIRDDGPCRLQAFNSGKASPLE